MNLVAIVTGYRARITPLDNKHFLLSVTGISTVPYTFEPWRQYSISSQQKYSSSSTDLVYVVEELYARNGLTEEQIDHICREVETQALRRAIRSMRAEEERVVTARLVKARRNTSGLVQGVYRDDSPTNDIFIIGHEYDDEDGEPCLSCMEFEEEE